MESQRVGVGDLGRLRSCDALPIAGGVPQTHNAGLRLDRHSRECQGWGWWCTLPLRQAGEWQMAVHRDSPYIWVTWLTKLLVGENYCEWAGWFKAHYERYDKVPAKLDTTA